MAQQKAIATTASAKSLREQPRVPSVYVAVGLCVLAVALGLLRPLSGSWRQQLHSQSTAVDEPSPVHTKLICTKVNHIHSPQPNRVCCFSVGKQALWGVPHSETLQQHLFREPDDKLLPMHCSKHLTKLMPGAPYPDSEQR